MVTLRYESGGLYCCVRYKRVSAAVYGIDGNRIEIEVDIAPNQQDLRYTTVGLLDRAVRESRERDRSAPKNGGYDSAVEYHC